jgi:hypothetical protein
VNLDGVTEGGRSDADRAGLLIDFDQVALAHNHFFILAVTG